jgi:hypothetical protein
LVLGEKVLRERTLGEYWFGQRLPYPCQLAVVSEIDVALDVVAKILRGWEVLRDLKVS